MALAKVVDALGFTMHDENTSRRFVKVPQPVDQGALISMNRQTAHRVYACLDRNLFAENFN